MWYLIFFQHLGNDVLEMFFMNAGVCGIIEMQLDMEAQGNLQLW